MYIFTVFTLALSYSIPCEVTNCETCSIKSSSICINCLPTHSLSDLGCSPNSSFLKASIENCQQQSSSENACSVCSPGYFLLNGRCEPICPSHCICQYPNICITSRNLERHGDHDDKNECDQGCERCTDDNTCEECFEGFDLVEGICADSWCGKHCEKCSGDNCIACADGFNLREGKCEECFEGCEKCSAYDVCEECRDDYNLVNGTCVGKFCDDNCEECSEKVCTRCSHKFYLQDSNCLECSEGCSHCSNFNTCERCEQNFNLTNGTCLSILCGDNCGICSSGICSQCSEKFYMQGQECQECPEGCKTCANSSYCYECEHGNVTQYGTCRESEEHDEEKSSKKSVIIAVLCSTGGIVIIAGLIYYLKRKRIQRAKQMSKSIQIMDENTPGFLPVNQANSKLNEGDEPSGLINDNSMNGEYGKITPQSFDCATPIVYDNYEEIPVRAEINEEKTHFIRNQCQLCDREFQMNIETIVLPCNHSFHMECVNKIINLSGQKICPKCKCKYY